MTQLLDRKPMPHRVHDRVYAFEFWIPVFRKNLLYPFAAKTGGFGEAAPLNAWNA
jgi:hypothetical protein